MNIPDRIVEQAASESFGPDWRNAHREDQRHHRNEVRKILNAAVPFIAAQALRDVVSKPGMRVRQKTDYGYVEETVYSRDTLASRADELDPQ